MKQDLVQQSAAATPPAVVSVVATAQGWSSATWVAVATVGYIVMQAAYLAWKWYREYRRAEREDKWWQKR